MAHHQKPESALRRANELYATGKKQHAIETLNNILTSKRHKSWTKTHEEMMKLYIRICVDLRRNVYAKDGLHQYRSISQQHQPESLQTVVQYFLDLAEQRCEDALSRSNFKLEASDDLDDIASAETLMLTSVTTEGDRERVERETLVPWLRFLHDAYRTVLDIVRNNNKLEHVYHNTCGRAYDFCIKYERKQEFRRICEFIRRHLVSIEKWSTQENPKRPSYQIVLNADVYEKHLKTKFRQLKAAVDSIPTYIECCAEMVVLTPSVKHADREGDCCDFNSWRREQQPVDRSVPLRPRRNPPLSASSCPSSMLTALGANIYISFDLSLSLPPSLPLSTVCVQSAAGAASSSCRPGSRAAAISL